MTAVPARSSQGYSHVTEVSIMAAMSATIERHHRTIIAALVLVILFFAAACTFHDVIPICHYLFGCDHGMHQL